MAEAARWQCYRGFSLHHRYRNALFAMQFDTKTIFLPRQAQGKHRKKVEKKHVSAGISIGTSGGATNAGINHFSTGLATDGLGELS